MDSVSDYKLKNLILFKINFILKPQSLIIKLYLSVVISTPKAYNGSNHLSNFINFFIMRKVLFVLALIASTYSFGQQYRTAIGVKGGYSFMSGGGISIKHFLGGSSAIEGNLGGGPHHLWIQGLYERNQALSKGFEWYWGLGADLGFWTNNYHYYSNKHKHYYSGAFSGIDALIGLEYTFSEIPINLALDLGPTIRLTPFVGFGWMGGVAIRFAIK